MGELGYTKGSDNIFISGAGERFRMEVRGVSGGAEEQDSTIVSHDLRQGGWDPQMLLLSSTDRASLSRQDASQTRPAGRRNGSVPIASAASASAAARHCGIRAVSNGDRGAPKYPPIAAPAVLNPSPKRGPRLRSTGWRPGSPS